jgi:hypothetical protein
VQVNDVEPAEGANETWQDRCVAKADQWPEAMDTDPVDTLETSSGRDSRREDMHVMSSIDEFASVVIADVPGSTVVRRECRRNVCDAHLHPVQRGERATPMFRSIGLDNVAIIVGMREQRSVVDSAPRI